MKIKLNDMVIVISGRSKGTTGKVIKLFPTGTALVEGVNMVKKSVRPNPQKQEKGGIIKRESKIDLSNIAILNPVMKRADRIGYKILKNGKKVRYFKSNGEIIDI